MRLSKPALVLVAAVPLAVLSTLAFGAADKTPPTVRKAAEALLGTRNPIPISRETEDGTTVYEAATRTKLEVVLTDAGQLRETEVALPVGALPTAVASAVRAKLPAGVHIAKAEVIVTADGVKFEVESRLASGEEVEYLVDASGKMLGEKREAPEHDQGKEEEGEDDDKD